MDNTPVASVPIEKPRRRLFRDYRRLGSWRKVAESRGVNVYYVHRFAKHGIIPSNRNIQRALGITYARRRSLSDIDRDMKLPISEMPLDALRAAFMFREAI